MTDCPNAAVRDLLPDLLHGRLELASRAMVQAHVESCADCQKELALLRNLLGARRGAPQVDLAAIVAALPAYRVPVARSWVGWRTAAAITLLVAGGSPASVPATVDFSTKSDLRKNAGVLNPSSVKIGNATARLSGTYQTPSDETVVNIKLNGEGMPAKDLEAFLPALGVNLPKGASLTAGTLSMNLDIKGPTNKLVTDGTVGLFNGKLSGFDLASKMSSISALTGAKTGNDLVIEKLTSNIHMAPSGLRADNLNAVLPALGTLVGNGTLDARNNLDFKMAATLISSAGSPASSATAGLGGLLGKVTGGGGGGCKGATTIPFLIQGTASDPKFIPDAMGLAAGMLKSQLSCAGGAASGTATQSSQADALSGLSGLLGQKKKP